MTYLLTDNHYNAFGRIVHGYATVEVGIKFCVAGILGVHVHNALVIGAPYAAMNLANVAKSLAEDNLKPEIAGQLKGLVSRWQGHTDIRTYVAHHRWREGSRPSSIRPTFLDVRTGKSLIKGFAENERDYTLPELFQVSIDLYQLNEDLKTFLTTSGLEAVIEATMEPKTAETSRDTESSEGAP